MAMESDMHVLSKEETFHLRISHLVIRYGTIAVRVYFDQQFHPNCFGKVLSKNYKLVSKLNLNAHQWEKLFPKDKSSPSSNRCDISLMTLLLKQLADINISDCLPSDQDSSKEAAVSRIKYYRNKICHSNTGQITEEDFNNMWNQIVNKSIVVLCPEMKQTCEDFESNIIDHSIKRRIESLLDKERRNDIVIQAYQELDIERKNLGDYQLQLKHSWKTKLQKFYLTKSSLEIQKKLGKVRRLIVLGCPGSGKSALAYHLAFYFEQNEGYTFIPLSSPEDIFRFRDKNTKQIFLFDDAFGCYSVEQSKLHKWENRFEYLLKFENTDNLKIILTCRSQIYETKEVKDLTIVADLLPHTANKDMSLDERKGICRMYLSENDMSLLDDDVITIYPFLPWICSAYTNSSSHIVDFFRKPRSILKTEIDKLKSSSSYFSLALIVLSNNKLRKGFLVDIENNEMFENVLQDLFEESEFNQRPSKQSVISGFNNLNTMFIDGTESCHHRINDHIFDIIVRSVGTAFPKTVLKYALPKVISSRIQFKRYGRKYNENTILIEANLEIMYYTRLLSFLELGMNWEVFGNVQCQYEEYRKDFLCFLGKQHKLYFTKESHGPSAFYVASFLGYYDFCKYIADHDFRQLFEITEGEHTSFLHICYKGYDKIAGLVVKKMNEINITSLLLFSTALFDFMLHPSTASFHLSWIPFFLGPSISILDQCCSHHKSPLMLAIEQDKIKIVTILLFSNVQVNQDIAQTGTALHYACSLDRAIIAGLLINCNADVNRKRRADEFTPLHCACRYGNERVVYVLLRHGADINITSDQLTPLVIACLFSQIKIVDILLNHGASANNECQSCSTPLHIAAMVGNVQIIRLLLKKNAQIDYHTNNITPLHIACSKGHVAAVVELLKHYRQHNILNTGESGISPLMIASSFGHADVVSILLENGANVNFIDDKRTTAIMLAVKHEFADVVEILLKNGAKIDNTLHLACKQGNENLVKLLLRKHADVYEVDDNWGNLLHETCGSPPEFQSVAYTFLDIHRYFINVSKHFTGIEHLLRSVNADIKNTDFEVLYHRTETLKMQKNISCLHLACYYGETSVVSFQLENGEDVNKTGALGSTPLFIACLKGNYDVVKLLLEKGANINKPGIDGFTPLCAACFTDTNTCVKLLLEGPVNVNCENNHGLVPLHIAVKTGDISTVTHLLENGANINKQSKCGHTALLIACNENRFDIAELLLKNNAKVNLPLKRNSTLLDFVSLNGNLELTELLLKHNASVNYGWGNSLTPLFYALQSGKTDVVKLLLKWKASINQKYRYTFTPLQSLVNDSIQEDISLTFILFWMFALPLIYTTKYIVLEEWLPSALHTYSLHHFIKSRSIFRPSCFLHMACSEGNLSNVDFLLKLKLNVNKCFEDGKTPLYRALENRHMQVANLLLMHGAEIDQEDENGQTPLHIICEAGDRENVRFLIKNGASINKTDSDGQTPLYIAAQNANIEVMEYLLKNHCFVNACRLNGKSALHASCATNETKPISLLLKYGINIDAIDHFGNSSLHISCQYGHCNVSELLILHDSNLNMQNSHGRTPLHTACIEGYTDIVLHLLRWGANINIEDSKGKTALNYACMNGFNNIATLLLNYRSIPTEQYKESVICLQLCLNNNNVDIAEMIIVRRNLVLKNVDALFHDACKSGNYKKAELFLKFKASVNKKDKDGKAPLFKAAENNHLQIVKLLLRRGADIDERGVDEMTPLFVSCVNGHKKVAEYLIEQQADMYLKNNENILPYQAAFLLDYTEIYSILEEQMRCFPKSIPSSVHLHYTTLRERREMIRGKQEEKINIKTNLSINNSEIVKNFLPFKSLINSQDHYGRTPLHRACNAGRSEVVQQLLENGAILSKDKHGQSGLHFACIKGHEKVVTILLRYKAQVNQKDTNGCTPLHYACFAGYSEISEILIKANANMDIINADAKTPLSLAIIENHQKVVDVLLKYGACVNKLIRIGPIPLTAIGLAVVYSRLNMTLSLYKYNGQTLGNNYFTFLRLYRSLGLPLTITSLYQTFFFI